MIPKANKDRKEGKNYRLFSLTSCLAKLLETAAKSRLTKHCERNRIISDNQTAYRKSRCTTDNLTKLTETIAKGQKTKRHTATIFLDVEKAFDSVHHETLIQKLHDLGLNPRLTHWITDFLRGRKCTIEINKCQSDAFYPRAGVPQGSVIAPQLFNIYVNGPPVAKSQISQYADDIALYYQSSNIGLAIEKQRQGLETLTNWLDKNHIKINHSKSNFLLFTNKKNSEDLTLTIRSQCLKQQKNVKFLGVTINNKLRWNDHAQNIEKKVKAKLITLNQLRNLSISRTNLLTMYKTYIRSHITYAVTAWMNSTKANQDKLQKLQNSAMRTCTKARRNKSNASLHAECKINTVREEQRRQAKKYIERCYSNNNKAMVQLYENRLDSYTNLLNLRTPLMTIDSTDEE